MTECVNCHDTGWISGTDQDGLAVATRCGCINQTRGEGLELKAQIPSKYANCDFDNFHLLDDSPSTQELRKAVAVVRSYTLQFPLRSDPHGLLLFGPNGVGKTHLAVTALREILKLGHDGRYINYQALLRMIRGGYDKPFGAARTQEYDMIEEVGVLLLDDLGSNRVTDWVEDSIMELIAQRHDKELPLIVTTNYSPLPPQSDSLGANYLGGRIGERATSRLREMCRIIAFPFIEDQRGKRPYHPR